MGKTEQRRVAEAAWIKSRQRWQLNVQADGKRKTFTSSTPGRRGKHEAEAKADEWLLSQGDPKVSEAWEECLLKMSGRWAKTTTATRKSAMTKHVLPLLENVRISKVTRNNWQKCIDVAAEKGLAYETLSGIRSAILALVNYCRRREYPAQNVFDGDIVIPRCAPAQSRDALSTEDIRILFAAKPENARRDWVYGWQLMTLTGLRRGEMCGLRWADVHDNYLQIDRAVNAAGEITQGKTKNARRIVVLSSLAKDVLEKQAQYLAENAMSTEWVFPGRYGDVAKPNTVFEQWRVFRKEYGISCKMHELRHTFISLVKSDMPLALLKSQVGHSNGMDTLGVYGHTRDGELTEIARIIDGAYLKVLK